MKEKTSIATKRASIDRNDLEEFKMWKWEAIGQPKAVAVIFHNAYEHHAWYAWLIEKLRHEGFQVVMGDLPGHGTLNTNIKYHDEDFSSYYTYASKLLEVAFTENLPVFVIANGLGSNIAIRTIYKNKYEIAGLILVSPWLQLKLAPGKMSKTMASLSAITAGMKLKHDITLNDYTRNLEAQLEMQDDNIFKPVVSVKWLHELNNLNKLLKDYIEIKLPDIPVLVMTGGEDRIIDANATIHWLYGQRFSSFQYKEWKRAKHSLFFEIEREEVFLMTRDFMFNHLRENGYVI